MRKYMSKRQRPCDFCRSRKSACRIEGRPPCRLCLLHGRDCTFVEAAQPRKKPAGPSTTEDVEASMQDIGSTGNSQSGGSLVSSQRRHGPSADDVAVAHPQVASPAPPFPPPATAFQDMSMDFLYDPALDGSEYQFIFRTPHSPASNASLMGRSVNDMAALPELRSRLSQTPPNAALFDGVETANAEVLGLSGDMDPYLLQRYQTDDAGIFKFKQLAIHALQEDPIPIQFLVAPPSIFSQSREETGHVAMNEDELRLELEQVVSIEMGRRLIALYDKFVAPQYPVFSTRVLPDPESSPPHLLAAIYSIAFPFSTYDDKLCIDLAYDALPYPALSRLINRGLAAELHSPSLAGIQALILLVVRSSSNPLISDASYRWAMLGLLVASAVNIGLHLDPSSWTIAPWQAAERRRLSFTIYSLDRWLAASLGRPPHIDDNNWLVSSVESADDLDSGLTPDQWTQMLDFSALTAILNQTLSKLYSMRSIHSNVTDPGKVTETVKALLDELSSVISTIRRGSGDSSPRNSVMRTITELGTHYLRLTMLRASLRSGLSSDKTDETGQTGSSGPRNSSRAELAICQDAFLDFIRCMKPEGIIGTWPPWCQTAFSSLCFSLLMTFTSSNTYEEARRCIEQLHVTRRELRLKATSFPVLRLGLLRIDSIFWRGVDKVLRLEPHVEAAFRDFQPS